MAREEINSLESHDAATVGVDIAFDFSRSAGGVETLFYFTHSKSKGK